MLSRLEHVKSFITLGPDAFPIHVERNKHECVHFGGLQGFWGSGEKGYLFSGSWVALVIV